MSARFSFSYFCSAYFYLLVVLSLFHLCFSNKNFDDELCIEGERQALVEFKHGLIDETDRLASWDVGEEGDCCRWVGITCDNSTGHIRRIHLRALDGHCHDFDYTDRESEEALKQRLRGKLSSSLLHLKQIRYLDLSCNDFGGIKVPKFIGSLRNLRYLNLSQSSFVGMIPPQLGNLSELHVLCLGSFQMPYETTSMMNMQWLSSLHLLQHLDLSGVDLSKSINWLQVINTLPSLVQLHLSHTFLTEIHPHVASVNLTSLSLLDLSDNRFKSSFPRWIFSITSLVSLDLSECSFHGLIPSSMDNLCNLRHLNLLSNDFSNISLTYLLESFFKCKSPHLESLILNSLGLSGTIPDSIGRLSFLRSLDLGWNQISGPIPSSIGKLLSLEELYLPGNQLNGSLPYSIGRLSSLKVLDLSNNGITGSISDSIGGLSFLRLLYLTQNLISGPIPSSIVRLSSLEELYLSNNRLNGSLPYLIGRLSLLNVLDLSDNELNGSLPDSLGQLSKLERLVFPRNLLTGVVSEAHFSKLGNLKQLDGGGNNLNLRPRLENWIPPFQLKILCLNSWGLGPQFPLWLQSQKDLDKLDISNTGISSPMPPESFWRLLPNLNYLDMSQNHIQGTLTLLDIPATVYELDLSSNELTGELTPISNFSPLYSLYLSNNSFAGSLHDFLCSNGVKDIEVLDLGNNHLSGVIPECWDKWPFLNFLELENNNFSGGIPTTLGFSSQLGSLNMRGNKLSGRLPDSLMNLTNLKILQLGRNKFVGSIPTWIGRELSHLRILNLRSNNFDGNIPHNLCYLRHIQILDLAHNNLSGNIPICFNNFSVLTGNETISDNEITFKRMRTEVMGSDSLVIKGREDTYSTFLGLVMLLDLSSNNLVGNIPSEITALRELKTLNFSRNRLTGRIPENIGDMKSLETLDLSLNMLSGELPISLSQLNFLSSFNVSHNNLTGRVPSSTQLQSLNESCFFGNKLCGAPLTESCAVEVKVRDTEDQNEEDGANWGLIISIVLGFVSGFWIVLAPLIVNRSWRIAYFRFMSEGGYMVYDFMHKYCFNMFSK